MRKKKKVIYSFKIGKVKKSHGILYNIVYPLKLIYSKPFQKKISCDYNSCGCKTNPLIWISHEYKVIYFEVPKAASSSIKRMLNLKQADIFFITLQLLLEHYKNEEFNICLNIVCGSIFNHLKCIRKISEAIKVFNSNIQKTNEFIYLKSNYAQNYNINTTFEPFYGDFDLVYKLYSNYFTFSFVRNPFDRIISNWSMFTQKPERRKVLESHISSETSFEEFLHIIQKVKNHHWQEQVDYLPFDEKGLLKLDFIGRLENFEIDWKTLCKNTGIRENEILKENKTERKPYESYYSNEARKIVEKLYFNDIKKLYPELL